MKSSALFVMGFTTEDIVQIVSRLTNRDYHEFYRKYVFSTDVPDCDRILGYAATKSRNGSSSWWTRFDPQKR